MSRKGTTPPRDNLVRALYPAVELRAAGEGAESTMPTLTGHFAVFNTWTEINSVYEGRFLERIAPGAFKKTFRENGDAMRVLFQHGRDPQIGDKPLGPIEALEEDERGAYYEVPLLDTDYNRELVPGLEAELYGSSFRFAVIKESLNKAPKRSAHNPEGLPERTVTEAKVHEFGPVTFPAYTNATAGVRSLTDAYVFDQFVREPERLAELIESMRESAPALPTTPAEVEPHSPLRSRRPTPAKPAPKPQEPPTGGSSVIREVQPFMDITELRARQIEIQERVEAIHTEHGADTLPAEVQAEWDGLVAERADVTTRVTAYEERAAVVREVAKDERKREVVGGATRTSYATRKRTPDNVYAIDEYRNLNGSADELRAAYVDGAKRIIDTTSFAHPDADRSKTQEHIERLLDTVEDEHGDFAKRIIGTASPAYHRAFAKVLANKYLTSDESRAMSLGADADGGFGVPVQLDPTIIPTSNGAVNPLREIARVETIVGKEWQGITSAGVTAAYAAEAAAASDNSPTLVQPTVRTVRAQAFVPFSIELGLGNSNLAGQLSVAFADAKDELEAVKFLLGSGTNEPNGLISTMSGTSFVDTAVSGSFATADLYTLEEAVPPRFRGQSQFLGNRSIYNRIRRIGSGSGGGDLWVRLGAGLPSELIGYQAREASAMDSTVAIDKRILVLGDYRKFLIVDRIGMSVELIPHLFGAAQGNLPTGQRGLYAHWHNNSKVLVPNAFRVLQVKDD